MAKHKKSMKSDDTPGRSGKAINVWIEKTLWEMLQAYLEAQRPRPTTTSVVEVALEDFLRSKGLAKKEG